jgi:hypothetical protein
MALIDTKYQNDKQEHKIFDATSIKAMLFYKIGGHQVEKWSRHCKIINFREKLTCKQCLNEKILSTSLFDLTTTK